MIGDTFSGQEIIGAQAEKQRWGGEYAPWKMSRLESADLEQISSGGRDTCRGQGLGKPQRTAGFPHLHGDCGRYRKCYFDRDRVSLIILNENIPRRWDRSLS